MRTPDIMFQNLINIRIKKNYSVSKLCEELNISRQTFYRWRLGTPPANYKTLVRIDKYITETEMNNNNECSKLENYKNQLD